MRAGIATLMLGYVLSQFYRAFLAVLTPVLEADLGATKPELASASGWWFLAFAAMQIPVGARWTGSGRASRRRSCLAVGGLGAASLPRRSPLTIKIAMALIGVGCSPVLMASYYIFARSSAPPSLARWRATIGVGSPGQHRRLAAADGGGRGLRLARDGLGAGRDHAAMAAGGGGAGARSPPQRPSRAEGQRPDAAAPCRAVADPGDDAGLLCPARRAARAVAGPLFHRCLGLFPARGGHGRPVDGAGDGGRQLCHRADGPLAGHPEMGDLRRQCGDAGVSCRAGSGRSNRPCSPR
jgi:hypothetical protein